MNGGRGVGLLVVVLALGGCSAVSDGADRMQVGDVAEGTGEAPGRHVFVQTPDGRLDFTVADPAEDAPAVDARAPEDGSIVAVSWSWDFRTAFAAMGRSSDDPAEQHVRLVADGRDYALDPVMASDRTDADTIDYVGTAYVAVDGIPDELAIGVEYDGLDQVAEVGDVTVLHEGPAAALYQQPDELARHVVDCGHPVAAGRGRLSDPNGQCRLDAARVPYEPTSGWVTGDDDRWLVLDARVWPETYVTSLPSSCGEGELGRVEYRLAGARPARQIDGDREATGPVDRVVFATSRAGQQELVIRAELSFPTDPVDCRSLRLTWRAWV